MSRGSLEVLSVLRRDAAHAEAYRLAHGYADGTLAEAVHESREAIAQVEALVAAGSALLSYRVGNYPRRGDLIDTDASRAQIDAFATSIAPFTPGQDSEGGGNG